MRWEGGCSPLGKLAIVPLVPGENDQPESVHITRRGQGKTAFIQKKKKKGEKKSKIFRMAQRDMYKFLFVIKSKYTFPKVQLLG